MAPSQHLVDLRHLDHYNLQSQKNNNVLLKTENAFRHFLKLLVIIPFFFKFHKISISNNSSKIVVKFYCIEKTSLLKTRLVNVFRQKNDKKKKLL